MTAVPMSLPQTVGRLVPATETAPPVTWLVESLIAFNDVTGFAVCDPKARTELGMTIVRALLGSEGASEVLGFPVVSRLPSVLVLATSRQAMRSYRANSQGDERVTVVDLQPARPDDGDYWPALHRLADAVAAGMVVVDTVQDIASGSPSGSMATPLERLGRTVVGLYRGNETRMGVGGGALWSAAHQRFWHEPKTGLMHPVDARAISNPWPVAITAPPQATAQVQLSGEAEQVRETAVLARAVGADADAGKALTALLEIDAGNVVFKIWNTSQIGTILPALGRHQDIWRAAISGQPIPAPSTAPTF
jgi:hypothetical protein